MSAPTPALPPGIVALHSNRTEALAEALAGWMRRQPLHVLEQEVVLVQSNGMGEWLKMALARELGIAAAIQFELPSRFAWRMYRHILGGQQVPHQTPLAKADMLWQLMRLLPQLLADGHTDDDATLWQPLQQILAGSEPDATTQHTLYQLALRIADVLDQYQVYRPDWLADWQAERNQLLQANGTAQPLPADAQWQAALWRALLHTQDEATRAAIRPNLHQRAMAALQHGDLPQQLLPRRIMLFGMSHLPRPILELLSGLSRHCQVLMAVPNPCQMYWSDALDGRELFARLQRRRPANRTGNDTGHGSRPDLAAIPIHAMHAHANPLLAMWGAQVRDFIRLLEHCEHEAASLPRIDLYEAPANANAAAAPRPLLQQVQEQIRDLVPLNEPVAAPIDAADRSICFQLAHSPVRELEALHDHLLELMHPDVAHPVAPREVVVMVPDIAEYAPLIRAVFGQYGPQDPRHIPFDITDLGAQAASALVQAVEWLAQLPEQRASLAELGDLLAVPAVAQRLGLDADGIAQIQAWMQGSGIRWGLDAAHRRQLGIATMGEQNTAWFGLQRMLLGYASDAVWADIQPYEEIGGLAASHIGALAHLLGRLQHWQRMLAQPASPSDWAQRWRALLADFLQPADAADQAALALLDRALQQWLEACLQAGFDASLPLAVARHAWLGSLRLPDQQQRFHAGGVTFCTLLPMRAIPFRTVCLLGMNDGVYPRRAIPNEMDLMRQPGLQRPGDRSRAQDDRQLMLEALLSAREQLLISWVGKNVRDNSDKPPSVLVAQLRDYLAARWSPTLVQQRTTEHPLQPFHPRYFTRAAAHPESGDETGPPLRSWAHEWQPAAAPNPPTATLPHTATSDACPRSSSLTELAAIWRNPVEQWFQQRLQTRFAALADLVDEREPLQIDGLQRWHVFQQLAQALRPLAETPGTSPQALQAAATRWLHALQRAGSLPLGHWGTQLQQDWLREWQFLLEHWHRTLQTWPTAAASREPLQWRSAGPAHIEDWAPLLRRPAHASDGGLYLDIVPHPLLTGNKGRNTHEPRPKQLILPWLQALLLGAGQRPRDATDAGSTVAPMRLIGLDAVLDLRPVEAAQAHESLQHITAIAGEALQQPLPFDFDTALSWRQATASHGEDPGPARSQALQKARSRYDGGFYPGQAQRNPYIARLWPDFDALHATGRFEALADAMLAPLQQWIATHVQVQPRPDSAQ